MIPRIAVARSRRFLGITPKEVRATVGAFLGFFVLLGGYYLLRPVREAVGARSPEELPWLYTGTFCAMSVAVPGFAWLVARFPRRLVLSATYRFFAVNLLLLAAARKFAPADWGPAVDRTFFIWLSVFNLAAVSVFWSHMADLFDGEQGKRLFGLIAGGGSLGGLFGSIVTTMLVDRFGQVGLLLLAAASLEVTTRLTRDLRQRGSSRLVDSNAASASAAPDPAQSALGGSVLAGLTLVLKSPYLALVCTYLFFSTLTGTAVYSQQAFIVKAAAMSREESTRFFAMINIATQALTLILQTAVTARLLKRIGVGATLCILPIAYVLGFSILGVFGVLIVSAVFETSRKSIALGVAEPTRALLFTAVDRETKYKAKNFIDTIVYRGGDLLSVWATTHIIATFSTRTASFVMVPIAGIWIVFAVLLGRMRRSVEARRQAAPSGPT